MSRPRTARPSDASRSAPTRALVAAAIVALLGPAIQYAPWPQGWLDAGFMGWWFPRLTHLTTLSSAVGWSVTAVALAGWAAVLAVCAAWALLGRSRPEAPLGRSFSGAISGRSPSSGHRWWTFWLTLAWPAALLVVAFPLTFGLAYRTGDLTAAVAARLDGRATDPWSTDDGESLAERLIAILMATAPDAPSGEHAADMPAALVADAARCVASTAETVRREFLPATLAGGTRAGGTPVGGAGRTVPGVLVAVPSRVKTLPAGTLLRGGYAGIVSPWLLEPHVDGGLPATAGLAVALHELAHTAGFAREAEAEAIGLLAGIRCDDPAVKYAAALRLAGSLLTTADPETARAYVARWPERARQDSRAADAAALRYGDPRLQRAADAVYDAYLRRQGGADGLGEYANGTALAIALAMALPTTGFTPP